MKKPTKRKYTRKPVVPETFVVYVKFPSSFKEYAYLCNTPGIRQGSEVIANGCRVTVLRTAASDSLASRYVQPVPDLAAEQRVQRMKEISARLDQLARRHADLARWTALAKSSPEAKRLVTELKKLMVQA